MSSHAIDWSKVRVPAVEPEKTENVGQFSGYPVTRWLSEGGADRRMQIIEEFWYEDPDQRRWLVPASAIIESASIPAPLWHLTGSPFMGSYRRASIVHDVASRTSGVSRRSVDRMYYFACLAGNCTKREAQLQYAGVRIGAWIPHVRFWTEEAARVQSVIGHAEQSLTAISMQATLLELTADIDSHKPGMTFDALEKAVNDHLAVKASQ